MPTTFETPHESDTIACTYRWFAHPHGIFTALHLHQSCFTTGEKYRLLHELYRNIWRQHWPEDCSTLDLFSRILITYFSFIIMSCKPFWFRCVAPDESVYGPKSPDGFNKERKVGPQMLSPWRREVLKRAPNCSDLSLLSGVSSLNGSHFGGHDTQRWSHNANRRPRSRCQLNTDVEVREGFLKVFVGGVRNIRRPDLTAPCYFVQLSVIPQDSRKVNTLVTSMKHEHDPVFNEVFEITPSTISGRPRLLIEVLTISKDHRRQLVGCMSFGIRPLLSQRKSISGWYYLLNDELGLRKHLKVQDQEMNSDADDLVVSTSTCDRNGKEEMTTPQLSPARIALQQTYMNTVLDDRESLGFAPRSRHDLTLSSIYSSSSSECQDISSQHSTSSLYASWTSDDSCSDVSTFLSCEQPAKAIVPPTPRSLQATALYNEDDGPSTHRTFLAAFDNFRSENITTYPSVYYRKQAYGESRISSLFGGSDFI